MITAIHTFPDETGPASRLAKAVDVPLAAIDLHRFPDGEGLPRVAPADGVVAIYRSLWSPDDKILPLLLAADALRRRGARRIVLVAPYLCYLRQDVVFQPGEPLSRDVVGRLLGERFEAVVTVEPHLHRTLDLSAVLAGAQVEVVSAADALGRALTPVDPATLVVGPDAEATPWAAALAQILGVDSIALTKIRRGDRDVSLTVCDPARVAGRPVILLDDICSSGATLERAIETLRALGAAAIDLAIVHALFDDATQARLIATGARRIVSTDCRPNPTTVAFMAADLADALKRISP